MKFVYHTAIPPIKDPQKIYVTPSLDSAILLEALWPGISSLYKEKSL